MSEQAHHHSRTVKDRYIHALDTALFLSMPTADQLTIDKESNS